ncbi:hypothetical protein M513_08210 [Trichuris suis]|uniref:Uncharacterized protein n=1 Tax=Trichuris suis TaxID=68888 RepID=A0A085M101_9BILA|nr:hypothetical protein M513_08210 [Trichuris suis]
MSEFLITNPLQQCIDLVEPQNYHVLRRNGFCNEGMIISSIHTLFADFTFQKCRRWVHIGQTSLKTNCSLFHTAEKLFIDKKGEDDKKGKRLILFCVSEMRSDFLLYENIFTLFSSTILSARCLLVKAFHQSAECHRLIAIC